MPNIPCSRSSTPPRAAMPCMPRPEYTSTFYPGDCCTT
jgi:hypothetical protein